MGHVRYLNQSGVYMLADLVEGLHKNHTGVFIAEMQPEPTDIMERLGTAPGVVAPEHIFDKVEDAIISATQHVRASSVPARAPTAIETTARAT